MHIGIVTITGDNPFFSWK